MHKFLMACCLALFPVSALAAEGDAQIAIDRAHMLRGRFVEEHQMKNVAQPMHTSGHFVIAPAFGLIWGLEQPLPTSTVVTQAGVVQDLGGMALKMPVKNLAHLYALVGGAVAGNWSALADDFVMTRKGDAKHWQRVLTPRAADHPALPYTSIVVSGSSFVENIVMTTQDGRTDSFAFTDPVLSPAAPSAAEAALFHEAGG